MRRLRCVFLTIGRGEGSRGGVGGRQGRRVGAMGEGERGGIMV
jgi:hypothetical protein